MSRFTSPNELHSAACREYLGGRAPETDHEWSLCVNYWAFNIAREARVPATRLMAKIMECPLSDETVQKIAEYQAKWKG